MVIAEHRFRLKDGREAAIRSPREEDAPQMLQFMRTAFGQTEFLLRYPEEFAGLTPEAEAKFFASLNDSPCGAMPVCFVDGQIVGNCQISWQQRIKIRHRASVAIAVLQEFWGLGIGTKLFEQMIEIAQNDTELLQLELDYVEGNSRARALYEKMGFRITGVKPNAIRLKDGTLLNEYSMVREISRG